MFLAVVLILLVQCYEAFHTIHTISSKLHDYTTIKTRITGRMTMLQVEEEKEEERSVWVVRRKIIRNVFVPILKNKLKNPSNNDNNDGKQEDTTKATDSYSMKNAFVISAFFMAISATIIRVGGRAAFINVLGLHFMSDNGIKEQVDTFIHSFESLGDLRYIAYLSAWIISKNAFLDPITIILALSSGVLFGGLWQGVTASVICSSLASLLGFLLSRTIFKSQVINEINERPALRAIDRACAREGFKTVFVLRLSPIFPIPMGAYNYIYGSSSVSVIDFLGGITLGSIKPYFLDAYLGIFGKSILDNTSDGNDYILIGIFGLVVLVGSFAAELAAKTWEEIQNELNENEPSNLSTNISLNSSTLNDAVSGSSRVNESTSDWQRLLGVQDSEIPSWLLGLKQGLEGAWERVGLVMEDEWRVVNEESTRGVSVDNAVGWNGVITPSRITYGNSTALMRSDQGNAYDYPGLRNIRDYELSKPDVKNLKEYSLESVVFSFALMYFASKFST